MFSAVGRDVAWRLLLLVTRCIIYIYICHSNHEQGGITMTGGATNGWAAEEMGQTDLGDKRLNDRLVSLCDRFSQSPESPINQACKDWAETKAAYRFFQNQDVEAADIIETHSKKTAERAKPYKTILAIQDTSYFIYTSHTKTQGLGAMSLKKGKHVEKIFSKGLVMHACLVQPRPCPHQSGHLGRRPR